MENVVEITEKNFDETIEKHSLLLIDFWAEWCGPCQSFQQVLEQVAPEYPDFVFASVNIDNEKTLAEEFNIRSIPSVMIMKNQVIVYAEPGAMNASNLKALLDQAKVIDPSELG